MLQGFNPAGRLASTSPPRPEILQHVVYASAPANGLLARECAAAIPAEATASEAMLCIDILSPHNLLLVQFIDDVFAFQSTCFGLRRVCAGLTSFTDMWRHRFAGGRKRASFMALGTQVPSDEELEVVGDAKPEHVSAMSVLGALIDADLTLNQFVDQAVGRLVSDSCALLATLRDIGLGIPHQVTAIPLRVEPSALFNIELCASADTGWAAVAKKLNATQYAILKNILEGDGTSFGTGGHRLPWGSAPASAPRWPSKLFVTRSDALVPNSFLLLLVRPGAPSSFLLLLVRHLLLEAMHLFLIASCFY